MSGPLNSLMIKKTVKQTMKDTQSMVEHADGNSHEKIELINQVVEYFSRAQRRSHIMRPMIGRAMDIVRSITKPPKRRFSKQELLTPSYEMFEYADMQSGIFKYTLVVKEAQSFAINRLISEGEKR